MAGTGDDHTSNTQSAGPPEELPLDSPNWITIEAAYQPLRGAPRYVGSPSLAATDLDAAVRDGRVPAMRKCFVYGRNHKLVGPERERLELAHWDERRLWVRSDGSLEVVEGAFRSRVRGPILIYSVKGYAYFVWKPALAKVWPDVFASTPPSPTPPSPTLTADSAATSTLLTPTVSESSVDPQADIDAASAGSSPSTEQTSESPESPTSRLQKMRRAGLLRGVRQKMAANWAREAYPPDGAIPEELERKDMADSINLWRKRKRKPPLEVEALRRFCGRFLQTYRNK